MVTFEEECSQVDDCEVQYNKAGYFHSIYGISPFSNAGVTKQM